MARQGTQPPRAPEVARGAASDTLLGSAPPTHTHKAGWLHGSADSVRRRFTTLPDHPPDCTRYVAVAYCTRDELGMNVLMLPVMSLVGAAYAGRTGTLYASTHQRFKKIVLDFVRSFVPAATAGVDCAKTVLLNVL